jgi:uncharacterized protein
VHRPLERTTHRRRALKADPAAQLALLDLQELDARADQLGHQRESLPELAEIAALQTSRAQLDGKRRDAQIAVDDLTREQKKADQDVEQVKARRTRDQDRMDKGLVTNPKDLERMQHELISLERRISELEDTELEVMEQLENAQAEHARLAERLVAIDARTGELTASRDAAASDVTQESAQVIDQRKVVADGVPDDLLALYEKVRAQKGGVGAAALRARRCGGCSLELTASDLGAIAKAPFDEVLRCEECNRILVRTSESGI